MGTAQNPGPPMLMQEGKEITETLDTRYVWIHELPSALGMDRKQAEEGQVTCPGLMRGGAQASWPLDPSSSRERRGEAPAEGGVKAPSPPFPSRVEQHSLLRPAYSTPARTGAGAHTLQIQRKTTKASLKGEGIGKRGERDLISSLHRTSTFFPCYFCFFLPIFQV